MCDEEIRDNRGLWIQQFLEKVLKLRYVNIVTCPNCKGTPIFVKPFGSCEQCNDIGFHFEVPASMPELLDEIEKF